MSFLYYMVHRGLQCIRRIRQDRPNEFLRWANYAMNLRSIWVVDVDHDYDDEVGELGYEP
jgi:hypothetical protein